VRSLNIEWLFPGCVVCECICGVTLDLMKILIVKNLLDASVQFFKNKIFLKSMFLKVKHFNFTCSSLIMSMVNFIAVISLASEVGGARGRRDQILLTCIMQMQRFLLLFCLLLGAVCLVVLIRGGYRFRWGKNP
jgi:hypothetical protein